MNIIQEEFRLAVSELLLDSHLFIQSSRLTIVVDNYDCLININTTNEKQSNLTARLNSLVDNSILDLTKAYRYHSDKAILLVNKASVATNKYLVSDPWISNDYKELLKSFIRYLKLLEASQVDRVNYKYRSSFNSDYVRVMPICY